jgi:hypothetical protein
MSLNNLNENSRTIHQVLKNQVSIQSITIPTPKPIDIHIP